jgi:hypothetical protein
VTNVRWIQDDEIRGRKVEMAWEKRRRERKTRRYLHVAWPDLVRVVAGVLEVEQALRLWLVVTFQSTMEKPRDGWVTPRRSLLAEMGLAHKHFDEVVGRLEHKGLVEVQRRRGKRPLLRLIGAKNDV